MAGEGINWLQEMMPGGVPVLAMSASLQDPDIKRITKTFGKEVKPTIMHGNLAQRGTMFRCKVSGQSSKMLKSSAEEFLAKYPDKQPWDLLVWNKRQWNLRLSDKLGKWWSIIRIFLLSKCNNGVIVQFVGNSAFKLSIETTSFVGWLFDGASQDWLFFWYRVAVVFHQYFNVHCCVTLWSCESSSALCSCLWQI